MTQAIDVTPDQRKTLLSLLADHLPNTEAWVYGSRVRWTSGPESDLDMAVFASPAQAGDVSALRDALEASDLPFRVDLFVWEEVPESFRVQIQQEHVVLVDGEHSSIAFQTSSLGETVKLTLSSVDKKIKQDEFDVLLCNYMDVYSRQFIRSDLPFVAATATKREIERCTLQIDDVVITKDSEKHDDIGVPALIRENIANLVCGYHLAILRPLEDKLHGPYLYYALQTEDAQHQFHSYANGVTRFGLRKDDILRVEVPLPLLPEQRTIAHILATLDEKIDLNRRTNETLEAMARAIFKDWFVDFGPVRAKTEGRETDLPCDIADLFPDRFVASEIGEIPAGWKAGTLADLIEINPVRRIQKGQVAPYLGMANMPVQGHVPNSVVDRPYGAGMRFINGDTLLARITPCLENGKTAYVDFLPSGQVGWGSTEYIVMRSKPWIPDEFAYCLARSTQFREFAIRSMAGTSGRQRVQAHALQQFPLSEPTAEVAAIFGKLVRSLFAQAAAAARESCILADLRDTLLPRMLSGELRMQNSERKEDEPPCSHT